MEQSLLFSRLTLALACAAAIIYFALPAESNPGYLVVLGVFLASFSLALLSHAPGGLGVLEVTFLAAMPELPKVDVLAATGAFALGEGSLHRDRRVQAGHDVGERDADLLRPGAGLAG